MKKKKQSIFTCPSCQRVCYTSELEESLKILKAYHKKQMPRYYTAFKKELVYQFADGNQYWACDDCFSKNKAIPAVPELILDSSNVVVAHYDTKLECERCATSFSFSKTEKKFWYEKLQFHTDAYPKNCKPCRQLIRKERNDNTRLSQLLSQEAPLTKKELEEISMIYDRMGKEEKKWMYERLAKRRKEHND